MVMQGFKTKKHNRYYFPFNINFKLTVGEKDENKIVIKCFPLWKQTKKS